DFLGDPATQLRDWIVNGAAPDMSPYLQLSQIQGHPGPWVALDGFLTQEDKVRGRRVFCFIRSFLVARAVADAFDDKLSRQPLGGRWLPEKPAIMYTFAGEI